MALKKYLIAAYIFLCICPHAFAKDVPSFDLGEIVIAKERYGSLGSPAVAEVAYEDIEIRSAQTVDEALDFTPGVRVTVGAKNEPYIKVRGFNQDDVLILLDGIPIADPFFGYVDLNQIPTESISKIKVTKGSVSALYGANTMGGVVNIITKKPTDEPYFEASTSLSDRGTRYHDLKYGVKYRDLSLWLSGSHRESDGFELSDEYVAERNEDGGLLDNSYFNKDALSLKLGFDRDEKNSIYAYFNYIDNEKGIPVHTSTGRPRYWRFTEWKRRMVALAAESELMDGFLVKGRVFYDKYDNVLASYDDDSYSSQTAGSSWTSTYDEYSVGASVYIDFIPFKNNCFKGAVNYKRDAHKEQDDSGDPWETYQVQTYSFGIEDEISAGERLSLLGGLSYDLFDQIEAEAIQVGSTEAVFNPMFSANYFLNPETLIYSTISRRTRFPTMNQLYSNTSGNPDLEEERNVNYEIGMKHDFKEVVTFEYSYFYNDVKNLIERASRNDPYMNISKATFEGVEATARAEFAKYFTAKINYTYLNALDKDPGAIDRSEQELSYVPAHKADLELQYTSEFGTACNLLGSYHGERFYYDNSNARHTLGGYFIWNAKLSQEFLNNWQASFFVENIFDRDYQEEDGYPQPGRDFLFTVKGIF